MKDQHRDPDAAGVPTLLAGRYRIISPLGSGGMADVYLAEDERLSRRVAVKVLKARLAADDEFVERFRIEAQAAASLNHSSIVAVYDRGSADGATYIAMEYVAGESLKQRLRRDGALPPDEAVADRARGALGARCGARAPHRPPRRDLLQRHAGGGRARGGHRLRHRAHGRLRAHAHRSHDGHVLVPLAGAGAGPAGGRAVGPLQPRRGALRDAHRARAVQGRVRRGGSHAARADGSAQPAHAHAGGVGGARGRR